MKTTICDICGKTIIDRQHKIKIEKEVLELFSFPERWFSKLDVCEKCAERIIYNLKQEEKNDN